MTPVEIVRTRSRRGRVAAALATALGTGLVVLLPITGAAAAQAPVGLGTAGSFAVLAGSGITNTGPTTITGDVGTHPTPAMTGFGSVTMTGTRHAGDAVALEAKNDLTTAYNSAAAATPTTAVATELGGLTLTPGVYGGPTLEITGTLTLDTMGDPNAVFIFKTGSTLITADNSSVIVLNGGTACNVFWQVSDSATLATDSSFIGTVLAGMSITANTGATVQGRLLAQAGAVTMDTNTITRAACALPVWYQPPTTAAPTTTPTTTAPELDAAPSPSAPTGTVGRPSASAPGSTTGIVVTAGGPSAGTSAAARPSSGSSPRATTGGSTAEGATSRTVGRDGPGLAVTGISLDIALVGVGALALGTLLLASRRGRRADAVR